MRFDVIILQARRATHDEKVGDLAGALVGYADASALQHVRVQGDHALDLVRVGNGVAALPEAQRKSTSTLAQFASSWEEGQERDLPPPSYQQTMPCPLQPMASSRP